MASSPMWGVNVPVATASGDKLERAPDAGAASAAPSISPDTLATCGRALYGDRWQSSLARALGISDRTLRYWLAQRSPVPAGVRDDLKRLLAERGKECIRAARAL